MRRILCRMGLHFLGFCAQSDGYVCACRRIHLWAEEIRDVGGRSRMDCGGYLPHGSSRIHNRSGQPELVMREG